MHGGKEAASWPCPSSSISDSENSVPFTHPGAMRMIWIVSLDGIYLSMTAEKNFIYAASKHKFKEEATTAAAVRLLCFYEMRERCSGDLFSGGGARGQ
jgi:hypothetical protein